MKMVSASELRLLTRPPFGLDLVWSVREPDPAQWGSLPPRDDLELAMVPEWVSTFPAPLAYTGSLSIIRKGALHVFEASHSQLEKACGLNYKHYFILGTPLPEEGSLARY